MKLLIAAVSAGLVVTAAAASAQTSGPRPIPGEISSPLDPYGSGILPSYSGVSDFDAPYAAPYGAVPPPPPRAYGAPGLLPPEEVFAILRENGFSPLGDPHLRGVVYTITVIDRAGEDGRLVIDARTGRILRFLPAYRMGGNIGPESTATYARIDPAPLAVRGPPRPPAPVPRFASRTPATPSSKPPPSSVSEAKPPGPPAASAQQSAAVQKNPAELSPRTTQGIASGPPDAKPAPASILPTQKMPDVQPLE